MRGGKESETKEVSSILRRAIDNIESNRDKETIRPLEGITDHIEGGDHQVVTSSLHGLLDKRSVFSETKIQHKGIEGKSNALTSFADVCVSSSKFRRCHSCDELVTSYYCDRCKEKRNKKRKLSRKN